MTSPLAPLTGIHFLIHPFYDASLGTHEKLLTESEFNERGRPPGFLYVERAQVEEDLEAYPAIARAYTQRAQTLGADEALVAFLPQEEGTLSFLDRRFERLYLTFLVHMQIFLGARLVLFYKETDPMIGPEAGHAVRNELVRRGWSLSPETPSYAFGETLEECVPKSVRNLRKALKFRKFTRVDPLFTDLRFQWPELGPAELEEWRREMRRYGIVLR